MKRNHQLVVSRRLKQLKTVLINMLRSPTPKVKHPEAPAIEVKHPHRLKSLRGLEFKVRVCLISIFRCCWAAPRVRADANLCP